MEGRREGRGRQGMGEGSLRDFSCMTKCLEQVLMNFWLKMTATKEKFTWLTDQW